MKSLDITTKWLETCGTASLQGSLYEAGIVEPQEVTLWFEQARPQADLILMADYGPACLVESILDLTRQGFKFTVKAYQKGCPH